MILKHKIKLAFVIN